LSFPNGLRGRGDELGVLGPAAEVLEPGVPWVKSGLRVSDGTLSLGKEPKRPVLPMAAVGALGVRSSLSRMSSSKSEVSIVQAVGGSGLVILVKGMSRERRLDGRRGAVCLAASRAVFNPSVVRRTRSMDVGRASGSRNKQSLINCLKHRE
jgi:hypothetical protein